MQRSVKHKVAAGAAVSALLIGGAVAAVTATGQSNGHAGPTARAHGHRAGHRGGDLQVAAGYLGVSAAALAGQLQSGKTLAQIADATSGKSAEGLVDALVAAKKAKLARLQQNLARRVTVEVNRPGGPRMDVLEGGGPGVGPARGRKLFANTHNLGFVAANYLGMAPAQLRAEIHSGKTLAQIADATPGKSRAGLIDALVAAKKAKLAGLVAAGRVNQAKQQRLLTHLQERITRLVTRTSFSGARG